MARFGDFCRVCLKQTEGLIDLKTFDDEDKVCFLSKLKLVFFQMAPAKDELPKWLCPVCKEHLRLAYKFVLNCQKSHSILIECLAQIKLKHVGGIQSKFYISHIKSNISETLTEDPLLIKKEDMLILNRNAPKPPLPVKYEIDSIVLDDDDDQPNLALTLTDSKVKKTIDNLRDVDMIPVTDTIIPTEKKVPSEYINDLLVPTENIRKEKGVPTKRRKIQKKSDVNDVDVVFGCNICFKNFKTPKSLACHLKWHKTKKETINFSCNICDIRFSSDNSLLNHLKVHESVYSCALCTRSFKVKEFLARHLETHLTEDETYYICNICDVKFTNVRKFRSHVSTHNKAVVETKGGAQRTLEQQQLQYQSVECNICMENFENKRMLIVHMRRHFEENNFE